MAARKKVANEEKVNETPVAEEVVNETPAVEENDSAVERKRPPREAKKVKGVITNCLQLNVRKEPSFKAEVIKVIPALSEVEVIDQNADSTFFKVKIADNLIGFCMKKYVSLK